MHTPSNEQFCYLTTTGRVTGRPHTIEIWFGFADDRFYLLSGGGLGSDWVKNIVENPSVTLRVGDSEMAARARIVDDPKDEALPRRLLASKYQGWQEGAEMSDWAGTALVVAIEPAVG